MHSWAPVAAVSAVFAILMITGAASAGPRSSSATPKVGAGANWDVAGGDLAGTRYSRLTQINAKNVKRLHLVWKATYDGTIRTEAESAPLAHNGVLYIPTPNGNVVAANGATGKTIWEYKTPNPIKDAFGGILTFQQTSRYLGLGGGKVFGMDNDGAMFALDAATGAVKWKTQVSLTKILETPGDPVYYKGVVYVGVSGAENGRGFLAALNADTGQILWRSFTVAGQDPNAPATRGGGSIWMYVEIDPKLGLIYGTTGNPGGNPNPDNLWANSVVAFDLKTGAIKWGFQGVHQDLWDYDCGTPPVLFDYKFKGVLRHAIEYTCKSDFHFELDRATGVPILPVVERPVPQSSQGATPDPAAMARFNASPTQPIPAGNSLVIPHCPGQEQLPDPAPDGTKYVRSCTYSTPGMTANYVAYSPGSLGGQDHTPLSYDPKLGYVYFCETVSVQGRKIGGPQGSGFTNVPTGWSGSIAAVNVKNNNLVWLNKFQADTDGMCFSGVATTAAGLTFVGGNKGTFYAYNSANGKKLWSYKGDQYIAAPPTVYSVKGKEYVAIQTGGQAPLLGGPTAPRTDALLVFALK